MSRDSRQAPVRFPRLALVALYCVVVVLYTLRANAGEAAPRRADAMPGELEAFVALAARLNFEGDLDAAEEIWARVRELDPTSPEAALGEVSTLYWRFVYDEHDRRFDARIAAGIERAIALAEARLDAHPEDVTARIQLGRALMLQARLDGTRGRFLRAGRAGERGREVLEAALAARPDRLDAKFELGLYYYYASALPDLVHWISWLWFVPSGDREKGLAYLDETAKRLGPRQTDARFVRMAIDAYHAPRDLARALEAAESLHAEFPRNALLHFELCETLFALGRYADAVETCGRLAARRPAAPGPRGRVQMARVWLARAQLQRGHTRAAARAMSEVEVAALPSWGVPWFHVVGGHILDVQGRRRAALARYRTALDVPDHPFDRTRELARAGLERPFRRSDLDDSALASSGG